MDAGSIDRKKWLGALALVVLCVVVYLPSAEGEFVSDDHAYVTGDTRLRSLDGLGAIWTDVAGSDYRHQYYPMTSTGFWLQYRLFGERPAGYHLVNVLLHAANAFLVWRLLRRLGLPMAWVAAAIFAVHPVHAQSVAWISELKNTLSAFLGLLAAGVFVDWLGLGDRDGPPSAPRLRYALGMALYLGALAAKTATCVLPAALLVVAWWRRGRVQRRDLAVIVPLAALGAAFVTLTVALEAGYGGAEGAGFGLSFLERLLVAGRSLWFYAGKLLWPSDLSFIYPRWTVDLAVWWQWLFPLAAAATLAALVAFRERLGRGPAAAAGYFCLAIVPVSLVNVSYHAQSFVADHWQYFASIGLIALVPCALARLPSHARVAAGALVLVLGAVTWQRAHVYASPQALWSDTLQRNPRAWAAHSNMGVLLLDEARFEPAMAHFREAIRIRPETAGAHDNLGRALAQTGRLEEAVAHLREAVRLRPGFARYEMHLGIALGMQGRHDEAVAHLRAAVASDPRDAAARHNLHRALQARDELSAAGPG